MPIVCPECSRPNSERAAKCMYCLASLPALESIQSTEADATAAAAPPSDAQLLIVLPQIEPVDTLMKPFAESMGVTSYDARLALSTKRPRLHKRIDSRAEAQRLSETLSRSGITHYVVAEVRLNAVPLKIARSGRMNEDSLTLRTGAGEIALRFDELLIAVIGEIRRERYIEGRVASTKGASQTLSSSDRLHLYSRDGETALGIDPASFDWFSILARVNRASRINLEIFLTELSTKAPQIVLDRNFSLEPPVTSRSQAEGELNHLLNESASAAGQGQIHDNEPQFQFYSRWRYCLARHLSRSSTSNSSSNRLEQR